MEGQGTPEHYMKTPESSVDKANDFLNGKSDLLTIIPPERQIVLPPEKKSNPYWKQIEYFSNKPAIKYNVGEVTEDQAGDIRRGIRDTLAEESSALGEDVYHEVSRILSFDVLSVGSYGIVGTSLEQVGAPENVREAFRNSPMTDKNRWDTLTIDEKLSEAHKIQRTVRDFASPPTA